MSTITIANPIAKIGDVIRGSLLADRPEQIPYLLQSVIEQVTALGGKFFIKNFWADPKPLSLGYVGVHIKIRMPILSKKTNEARERDQTGLVNQEGKYILMELQLHVKEIMDGTKDCAKEIAHLLYKAPREAEEKISSEIISSSQLVYLTAMTKLLSSKEDLKKVEDTLQIIQAMTKADKKIRLVMATAMLLHNRNLAGEWNEQLQVVVPKDSDAVAAAWMGTAEKINKLLNLPIVKMDERDIWTNTATSVNELYADAVQIAPFFRDMCEQASKSQPGCSVNFGPGNQHMLKEKPSLQDKIKADLEEELGRFMTQLLIKIGRSLFQITDSDSVRLENLFALQSLNLSSCSQIIDSDLVFLESLSALQSLSLSECSQITDDGLAYLKRLTGLRSLNLSGCRITDRGLAHLETLAGLQSLNLAYCHQITDGALVHLWRLTELQSLNLYGCNKITDSGLARAGLQNLNHSRILNPVNPSQPASDSIQPTKDAYVKLLLRLLENPSIQIDLSLVEILESQVEEVMGQETQILTMKQKNSYQWAQELLVDQKVSQLVAKNLRKLHAPEESKRPPIVPQSPALSSQTSSTLPTISKNLVSLREGLEVSFREITEILTKAGKPLSQITGLESLAALKSLDLSESQITDRDLARLRSLIPMLQNLDLFNCHQITFGGLYSVTSFTALQSLNLAQCNQFSSLPWLGGLTALQSLNLTLCGYFTDDGLTGLSSLTALQNLNLSYCNYITDKGLLGLSSLTGLQNLNLHCCTNITDKGLAGLSSFTRLQSLDLTGCTQITDRSLASLGSFTRLQSLNLSCCDKIIDRGLASLGCLTALQSLNLSYCTKITKSVLATLRGFKALRILNLSCCDPIADRDLAGLGGLTALQNLNLYGCYQITDKGLAHLAGLTALQNLNLWGFTQITDRGLAGLSSLTALQSLNLSSTKISDSGLSGLVSRLTALQSLDLSHTKITDSGLSGLVSRLTVLQSLNLCGCTQITDSGLSGLVSRLTALQSLDLNSCTQITDSGFAGLISLTALQSLSLSNCKITDKGLAHLASLTALQDLNLSWCTQITDSGLVSLVSRLTALQSLALRGCTKITDATKDRLRIHCKVII